MGTISEFFNYSKFEARGLGGTADAVVVDVEYSLSLEIFDAIGLEKPALVTASLVSKKGRDVTALPTVVSAYPTSCFIHLFQFTASAGDWNGSDELLLNIIVTDSSAFVYKITHQVKA